jgi:hypothetical protein
MCWPNRDAAGGRESQEHGGVVRVTVELPKVGRSDFEKNKSKNFKNGVDPGRTEKMPEVLLN